MHQKGGDLPPRRECAGQWHADVFAAMPKIELVILIGQYAQAWHLGAERSKTLTETVRNWHTLFTCPGWPRMLPLPHPSWRNSGWLKKNPWFKRDVLPLLQSEVHRLI